MFYLMHPHWFQNATEFSSGGLLGVRRNAYADSLMRARTFSVHSVHLLQHYTLAAPTSHHSCCCVSPYGVSKCLQFLFKLCVKPSLIRHIQNALLKLPSPYQRTTTDTPTDQKKKLHTVCNCYKQCPHIDTLTRTS